VAIQVYPMTNTRGIFRAVEPKHRLPRRKNSIHQLSSSSQTKLVVLIRG
jgi:hypothetical protein